MMTVRTLARLSLASAAGIVFAGSAYAQPVDDMPAQLKVPSAPPTAAPTLSLAECLAIGLDRQPNIRAARVSLAAAEAGYAALHNIHPWTTLLAPDLPVRRQQAARGLNVARADVCKAEQETRYDITRLYYTYIYARQQEQTATGAIDQLQTYYETTKGLVDSGAAPEVSPFTLYQIEAAISQAKTLRVPAVTGQPLALAALKEAMGVEQGYAFTPRDSVLPVMGGTVTRDVVVSAALAARPEIAQAAAGVDAFRLEVAAQQANRFSRNMPTLAAGSDLHSRTVPQPVRNGDYKPGALAPEMPAFLAGRRDDRVAKACEHSARQDVLFDKTRGLVELEAINAFHKWEETVAKLAIATERLEKAKKLAVLTRDAVAAGNRRYDLFVQNEGLIAKWTAEYLEAVFEHVKALAALERVSAGGVRADFPSK